ncbi:sugar-transfer associated ATP-grasp domain-containing protein [Celerinatantimonas sp. YJH-8]|uniref:sugar-transfer associated ATP-grasp domain-containing protein n=1 Tax=Celerinatantimonas sp. YJH-8 TaxID=3228714 RepID=UPI0038BEA59D
MSWHYLLPKQSQWVKAHRNYWWHHPHRLPKPLWLMLELGLWLRWLSWSAWHACLVWVRLRGDTFQQQYAVSRRQQYWVLLKLALNWGLHPAQSYAFNLIQHPKRVLHYVYNQETAGYHHYHNQQRRVSQASLHKLQDKTALAEYLTPLAIQVAKTCTVIPQMAATPLQPILSTAGQDAYFIKSRSGNQAQGAFKVWQKDAQWLGESFNGQPLDATALETAWQYLLQNDDALIQPLYTNHPALDYLSERDDVITLRVISRWQQQQPTIYHQQLEIPYSNGQKIGYVFLTLDDDGLLLPATTLPPLPQQQALNQTLHPLQPLPFHSDIIAQSLQAHRLFPDIHGIAWDWVITPTAPILLEGNSGWGTAMPQHFQGPLLNDPIESD